MVEVLPRLKAGEHPWRTCWWRSSSLALVLHTHVADSAPAQSPISSAEAPPRFLAWGGSATFSFFLDCLLILDVLLDSGKRSTTCRGDKV